MSYTYPIAISGINEYQLKTEISSNTSITKNCLDIGRLDDNFIVVFSEELSIQEKTILDNIVNNHIPIPPPIIPDLYIENKVIKSSIDNNIYTYLANQSNEIHISKGTQTQYSSIKDAITNNNFPNIVFVIHPSSTPYIEDNPIVLPEGCVLRSEGNAENTVIQAMNSNFDLLILGQKTKIFGVTLQNASGSGARGIYFDGSQSGGYGKFSGVMECFIKNCDIGIESDGKNGVGAIDTLYCDKLLILCTSQQLNKGVYCHSGGQFISTSCQVIGVPGYFPIMYAIYCSGTGSKVSMTTSSAWFCTQGLYLDDNAQSELTLITFKYNDIAIQVGPTNTNSILNANSVDIKNSTTYDLDIHSTDSNIDIYSGNMDSDKINNPNKVKLNLRYNHNKFGRNFQGIVGDVFFGSIKEPTKLSIGEGQFNTNGIIVLSNDNLENGTWLDNSEAASSFNAPAFNMFSSINIDSCLYLGSDVNILGFKIEVTVSTNTIVSLDDLIYEYWNGSNWIAFNIMQRYFDYPCNIAINSFVSEINKYHVRFGLTTQSPFAYKTLNGLNKKWVRIRIVNTLPNIPVLEYIKLHVNNQTINSDGFVEYFGNSRTVKPLFLNEIYCSNNVTDSDLHISQNLVLHKRTNVFPPNLFSSISMLCFLPNDIDTSFPVKLVLKAVVDNSISGNIELNLRHKQTDLIYINSYDAPLNNETTINKIISINNTVNLLTIAFDLDISRYISGNLYIYLERVNNDTYSSSLNIVSYQTSYIACSDSSHLLSF